MVREKKDTYARRNNIVPAEDKVKQLKADIALYEAMRVALDAYSEDLVLARLDSLMNMVCKSMIPGVAFDILIKNAKRELQNELRNR